MEPIARFGQGMAGMCAFRFVLRLGGVLALAGSLALPAASLRAESTNADGLRLAGAQITNGGGRASDFTGVILYGRLAQPAAAQRAASGDGNIVRGTLRFPLERRATALDWMLYE